MLEIMFLICYCRWERANVDGDVRIFVKRRGERGAVGRSQARHGDAEVAEVAEVSRAVTS